MIKSDFANIGFEKFFFCKDLKSISGEFSQTNRCGVYILHFANHEYYVGLAVDVVKRYAQHIKNFSDIEFISFKEVAKAKLSEEEKRTVYALEDLGKKLRNINIVSIVTSDTDLDLVIAPELQAKWISNTDSSLSETNVKRFDFPELRAKYSKKLFQLKQHEFFDDIAEIIHFYITHTIPFPKSTEYSFWSVSCLPSPGKPFARFNISWQETMVLFEDIPEFDMNNTINPVKLIYLSVWLSKSILEQHQSYNDLESKFSSFEADDIIHSSGGKDQKRITIELSEFYDFVQQNGVLEAIKTFNLRLMRKGGCQWKRYHCFELADIALN